MGAAASLADVLDEDAREDVLERALGLFARTVMKGVILHERDHKGASFRVPKSLKRTVIPGT